jgi:hypothetical protein
MRLGDGAVLVDDVGDAARVLVFRAVARAVGEADLALGVADQRERKVELLREALVFFRGIEADADDLRVLLLVLANEVPEPGTLDGSAGGVGLGIEPEDDALAAQVAQADRFALVIDGFEVGRLVSRFEHLRPFQRQLGDVTQFSAERHGSLL